MLIRIQLPLVLLELLIIFGIGNLMEVTAVDRWWLLVLGDLDGIEPLLTRGDVDVASHEVEEVCALNQDLRHPRIVIFLLRDVAVRALFRFFGAHSVRDVRTESLSAEAFY